MSSSTTKKQPLVIAGHTVSSSAYGTMNLALPSQYIGGPARSDSEIHAVLKHALSQGINFWNGGEFYGTPDRNSLTVFRSYFERYPEDADKVVISIKGCLDHMQPNGSKEYVRQSVENCIRMLGDVKKIDVFEPARIDSKVDVEETFGELVKLKNEGKIGGISISEAGPETLRRVAKITKLEFLETEVSLFEDNVWTAGIAEVAGELGIPILAYSPLGRGWLTGAIKSQNDLKPIQQMYPRFQGEAFNKNLELVEKVKQLAAKEGVTPAQYSIAWIKSRSEKAGAPVFIPLPGGSTEERVTENFGGKELPLEKFAEIDEFLKTFTTAGDRYTADQMAHLNG